MSEHFQNQNDITNNIITPLDGGLNFKKILGKFLAFIPYFVVSILFSIFIAFLINRYSDPKYLIQSTLLIKEKNARGGGMDGADNFLQGMQLLSTNRNIENEQGILKSKSMVVETLKNLDFGISYFAEGSVRKSDLYGNLPFIIKLDSNHLQCRNTYINISFLPDEKIECWIEGVGDVFVPRTGANVQRLETMEKWVFKFNEPIVTDYFSFKMFITDPKILLNFDVVYSIKLNQFESLVNQYYNKYNLKPINKQASIIEITKEGQYPEREIAFINQLSLSYIQQGLDDKNKVTQNTIRFIDDQLKGISDTLGLVENQLQSFRAQNKIVDLSVSGSQIMGNVVDLEKQKAEQNLRNKYYTYLEQYVRNANPLDQLIAPSIMGVNDPVLITVLQKMVELFAKKKTLEMSYQKDNPILKETEQNLINLQNTLLENIHSIQNNSEVLFKDLNSRIVLAEIEIGKLPANEQKLLSITRRYQLSDKLYTYLLEKRAEAGIAGAGVNPDNKILDTAMVIKKTYPMEINNYTIALLIGFIFPLIIILAIDFFNNKIENHAQLQQLTKIPLVGSIVHNTKNTALVIANHPKSQVSEAFRNLRSNISYLGGKKVKKIIMVTSTVSGEGKTFISMNLSSVMAIGGYKTLLIGVDLRKPKIFQDFKLDNSFGLTNYLIGKASKESIVQHSGLANLDIITAGPTPPNPSELIMSNAFYQLIDDYKKEYDIIILDTPPIGLVADGMDIMKHSDIVLYVARQNISQKNYLSLINELYSTEKDKSIGLIFNDVNFASVYGYGYGYGAYGYGYGSGNGYSYGYSYGYGYGGGYGYGYGYGGYGETEVEKKPLWKRVLGR
jgi:tyrosine-protein kinase Etk/Wzc